MSLTSRLFVGDPKLEAAATSNPDHIQPGAVGEHVAKIQQALMALDGAVIDSGEVVAKRYGPSTASAVLSFKKKRNIINRSYQTQADNIVGIMTIAALDKEMLQREQGTRIIVGGILCEFGNANGPGVPT
jgi:peptidoglycan hydrolase-like protein with peptidoglycan-binding domain